jgi:hypothetical protein
MEYSNESLASLNMGSSMGDLDFGLRVSEASDAESLGRDNESVGRVNDSELTLRVSVCTDVVSGDSVE